MVYFPWVDINWRDWSVACFYRPRLFFLQFYRLQFNHRDRNAERQTCGQVIYVSLSDQFLAGVLQEVIRRQNTRQWLFDCHTPTTATHWAEVGTYIWGQVGTLGPLTLSLWREFGSSSCCLWTPPPPNRPPPLVSVSAWLSVICWNRFSRWQDPGCLCASPVNSSSVSLTHWVTHSPNISPVYSCTWWLAHIFKWGIILT